MSNMESIIKLLNGRTAIPSSANCISDRPSPFIKYFPDRLSVKYTGRGHHYTDIVSLQMKKAFDCKLLVDYFEMKVIELGERKEATIGITEKDFLVNKLPGWSKFSIGYKADGKVYFAKEMVKITLYKIKNTFPRYEINDIIGCGINYLENQIFFTRNGIMIGNFGNSDLELSNFNFYPTIGLHSNGEHVRVNFGKKEAFVFDVGKFIEEQRNAIATQVSNKEIDTYDIHELVRNYLLYHGYTETLESFEAITNLEKGAKMLPQRKQTIEEMNKNLEFLRKGSTVVQKEFENDEGRPRALSSNLDFLQSQIQSVIERKNSMLSDIFEPNNHKLSLNEDQYFQEELGIEEKSSYEYVRGEILQDIRKGKPELALEKIREVFPDLENRILLIEPQLYCQTFIETIRKGEILIALEYAREKLKFLQPFKFYSIDNGFACFRSYEQLYGLLCYENPEEGNLRDLISQEQREVTADFVNESILEALGFSGKSNLQMILTQAQVSLSELKNIGNANGMLIESLEF